MNWKPIKGYEGYYEVSDTGVVRSLDRIVPDSKTGTKRIKGRIMKQSENKDKSRNGDGYYVVNLRKFHTSCVTQVHKLVAEAFLSNEFNLPTVNHKDGNKHNNNVENLEWATYSDNNLHALNNGLRHPRGNVIIQRNLNGSFVSMYQSACEASRKTGIGRAIISHCLNHRVQTAGGYLWEKVEECNDYSRLGSTTEDELPLEVQEPLNVEDIVCADRNI